MNDTTPEAHKILLEKIRSMSPEDRLKKGSRMFDTAKKFAEIAVKKKNKNLSGIDLKMAVFRWIYQKEFSGEELENIERRMREHYKKESH